MASPWAVYFMKFGETIEGYAVPVLNEREIRASAGIMFLILFWAMVQVLYKGDSLLVKYVVVVFFTDFAIRIFLSPRFSPILIIGRLIVSNQTPEYVGAAQKKFAWKIGLALSGLMFVILVILNSYSIITGVSCVACLIFLFFESAFGICLGCLFYKLFYKHEPLYCAGEICEKKSIQKVPWVHLLIVVAFFAYVLLAIIFLNDYFQIAPTKLHLANSVLNAVVYAIK